MKEPDKIYVHEVSARELIVPIPYSIEYIRKDALLEWCMKKVEEYRQMDADFGGDVFLGNRHALHEVIAKIKEL